MKFTNFKISRESIFPIENITHVRSCKTFYHISVHFRYRGFRSVSKPRKPVLIFRTGPTTKNWQWILCSTAHAAVEFFHLLFMTVLECFHS